MKKFICKHPWSHFEVNNPNGDVTMCCNNDTVLGNVNDASIADIWNGSKFKAMRKRMVGEGAHAFCPHTCPVLQGGKKYENLDWYDELREDGEAHQNAVLNEEEFAASRQELSSAPRWLRFTYSYACNLDCYHCYQREDAKMRLKLPESFMLEVPEYARKSQVIYPFGGEPFFFKPVIDFLENHNPDLESRFFFITNATLLTDRIYETLERLPITCMAASLDAATPESFDALRVRGRNANWQTVMTNLDRLRELKHRKGFTFTVSMTLNSVNCGEIERFVDLALAVDAEPLVMLVANPDQTSDFQKEFLVFTEEQMDDMFIQIERSLTKIRAAGLDDPETFLKQLLTAVRHHREHHNSLVNFNTTNIARKAFHMLPEQFQGPVRRVVQEIRTRSFDSYADKGTQ
ncbi:MAG: radical SAM protein [Rhodospirillales bacterium]|nr:radical SAM protein [Rhodospirillales bacterium]